MGITCFSPHGVDPVDCMTLTQMIIFLLPLLAGEVEEINCIGVMFGEMYKKTADIV